MELTINLTPNTAAMQLKYDYAQLGADASTVRGTAIEIKNHAERAKSSMIVIGQKLAEVKALLPHGQFEDWCSVEFEMSQRTAQRMMAAAEVFGGKSDTVSLLSDSVMYMLSGPSVPEAARVEVVEIAKDAGASPTKAEVQAVLDKHKPDEELRDKCHKIEFWLMGKGWSGFGYQQDDGQHISGIQKGEHKFSWINGDWPDAYEKVKAAEKIERAAIAAFIKLTPPKPATVSPLPTIDPGPQPENRPLPSWVEGEPDKPTEPLMDEDGRAELHTSVMVDLPKEANKSSSSMATPTALADRQFQLKLCKIAFEVALEKLELYVELTGHFTDIPQAQRVLEKIIANLKANMTTQ